jgi:hypothetical protein
MNKYILWLVFLPTLGKAQYQSNQLDRSLISSLELGTSIYNTKVFEASIVVGFRDNTELSSLEIGYVYKQILDKDVGHSPVYHGIRGSAEVRLYGAFGTYGTYDIIKGKRWLYDDLSGNDLKVHDKIHGEGTLGVFFAPKRSLLKFYVGIEPFHYDPLKVKEGLTPHKSSSINLKIKHTLDL